MAEARWTPSLVEERLAEAASVLKRLPEPKLQGYYNLWPRIIYEFSDLVGQEPRPMRVLPSPAAISSLGPSVSTPSTARSSGCAPSANAGRPSAGPSDCSAPPPMSTGSMRSV
jgi:hypothetical protein